MPFIGNQPAEAFSSFQKQDFTTSATTSYTLDHPVANGNEIALFINFVRQEPTAAYTASGTSLTLTSATSASDDMYCVYLGKAVQTVNPPNGSVGTTQLADNSITSAKLASSATNTPAFLANLSSSQVLSDNTLTKVQFDNETFDTDSDYDNSTNYRFTPQIAGKYYCYSSLTFYASGASTIDRTELRIRKNGSNQYTVLNEFKNNPVQFNVIFGAEVIDLNGSTDYVEIFGLVDSTSGTQSIYSSSPFFSTFGAYRIIGA